MRLYILYLEFLFIFMKKILLLSIKSWQVRKITTKKIFKLKFDFFIKCYNAFTILNYIFRKFFLLLAHKLFKTVTLNFTIQVRS